MRIINRYGLLLAIFIYSVNCLSIKVSNPSSVVLDIPPTKQQVDVKLDRRPFQARAAQPRAARRLNHAFKHLYRHHNVKHKDPVKYLMHEGNFTKEQVMNMSQSFPPLLDLNVPRHLQPKLLFLTQPMKVKNLHFVPPHFYGARLERILAPRHAFMTFKNLPHGADLVEHLSEFLVACRQTKTFAAFCNQLSADNKSKITPKEVEAFDALFQRGLMAAARDELVQWNNTWPLYHISNITGGQMVDLLIQHGANPLERDARGATLLHWAAGTGNLQACKVLLPYFDQGAFTESKRDGATPLHWAVAGANAREFGIGGHVDVCQYLIDSTTATAKKGELVNTPTKEGNSPLMWAAWSGTLDAVKLLVRNRANIQVANRNGCTIAHWAASGGSLETCRYLHNVVNIDFELPNHGGNTPLTHAVAFGRVDIVNWLRNEVCTSNNEDVAAELAKDFVDWTEGDEKRQQVLDLFGDWAFDDS